MMSRVTVNSKAFVTCALALCCLVATAQDDGANKGKETVKRLLPDDEFVEKYVAEFPVDEYKIFEVEGVGKFYLKESAKDEPNQAVVDLVKATLRRGEILEKSLYLTMQALVEPGTVAVDVGAHIGAHTVVLSKLLGPDGKVYAFEPQLERYRHLKKNLELNDCINCLPMRYAVGDKHDVIEIARETVSELGSGGEKAELRTLDSFNLSKVSLIKIDVESYEDSVINGATETIRRNRPLLLVEIRGGNPIDLATAQQKEQIAHTVSKLEAFDYEVVNIGGHDYLAVPTERSRQVNQALRRELGEPSLWERFLLPGTMISIGILLAVIIGIRKRGQRRP